MTNNYVNKLISYISSTIVQNKVLKGVNVYAEKTNNISGC